MKGFGLAALLSFNGGFVDTAGFLGLQGLFTAHVTGNFVTLAAALVLGTHGVVAKLLALPEFVLVIALACVAGTALRARGLPSISSLRLAEPVLIWSGCDKTAVCSAVICCARGQLPGR